jgi:GTP pyrophosphokinase
MYLVLLVQARTDHPQDKLPQCSTVNGKLCARIVKTKWAKNKEIIFLNRHENTWLLMNVGVINKITNVISGELRINISALTIESGDGMFEGMIKVFVHDKEELDELVNRLKLLNGFTK